MVRGIVMVRETELISQAVAQVSMSIVRLYTDASEDAAFLGLGIVFCAASAIFSVLILVSPLTSVRPKPTGGFIVVAKALRST